MPPVAARKQFLNQFDSKSRCSCKGSFCIYGPTAGNHYDDDHVMLEMHDSLAAPVLLIFSFEIEALNSPHASELLTQTPEKKSLYFYEIEA